MAFFGFFSQPAHFGGGTFDSGVALGFDSDFSDGSVMFPNNVPGRMAVDAALPDCWVHFQLYVPSSGYVGSSSDGHLFQLFDESAGLFFKADMVNGTIVYTLYRTSSSTAGQLQLGAMSAPGYLAMTAVDLHIESDPNGNSDSNCRVSIYHNGVLAGTLMRTNDIQCTGFVSAELSNVDVNSNMHYSEGMVSDEDTRGLRLATMTPDAAGTDSAWDGDYTSLIDGEDGAAISSGTGGERESWNLSAYNGPVSPSSIRGVFIQSAANAGPVGPSGFQHSLEVGGTVYDSATIIPVYGTPSISEWALNPDTAAPWLPADLAALIAGVESIT